LGLCIVSLSSTSTFRDKLYVEKELGKLDIKVGRRKEAEIRCAWDFREHV
jgi:hypothetical protein